MLRKTIAFCAMFSVNPIGRTSNQKFSIDQQISDFFPLCLLFCNSSKPHKTRLISLVDHLMKLCDFLHGCTSYLNDRSSAVFSVNSSGVFSHCLTALFGTVSSPYYLASFLALGRSFAIFFATFFGCKFLLSVVLFHVLLQTNSILNVRSTFPNVS